MPASRTSVPYSLPPLPGCRPGPAAADAAGNPLLPGTAAPGNTKTCRRPPCGSAGAGARVRYLWSPGKEKEKTGKNHLQVTGTPKEPPHPADREKDCPPGSQYTRHRQGGNWCCRGRPKSHSRCGKPKQNLARSGQISPPAQTAGRVRLPLPAWRAARSNEKQEPRPLPPREKGGSKAGTYTPPRGRKGTGAGGKQDNPHAEPNRGFSRCPRLIGIQNTQLIIDNYFYSL